MSHEGRTPSIPAEFRELAAAELATEKASREAFRKKVERDQRCVETVWAFGHAADALWAAPPDQTQSLVSSFHAALLGVCAAMAEAGRLEAWDHIDHDKTYRDFRFRGGRELSRSSYDWACELLHQARAGQLPGALLVETWGTEGLRDSLHWLRVFLYGLSGEGAPLPGTGQQLTLPAPTRQEQTNTIPERPTIYWLGDRTYRVDDSEPVAVSETDDGLLQAFLGHPVLDKPLLAKRSGVGKDQISTVMKRFGKKHKGLFAKAVFCPGRGGKGQGYRVNVIDARPDRKI
jgi:hypothetical protein